MLDLQRLGVTPECRDVTSVELALNQVEIAALLSREAVEPTPALVQELGERTSGWAWGVRLGASLLARSATVAAALHETDLTIADYLRHSILRDVSQASAELLTATSMVADVSPDVAAAIIGDDRGLTEAIVTQTRGFVRVRADGSFTVHPLLRRHLQQQLRRRPSTARAAVRRASQCTAELGDVEAAISIAVDDADWSWAAQALVESLHVPRLLVSGRDPLLDTADVVDSLGAAQPMLLAAAALGRSWPEMAARVVADATAQHDHPGPSSPAAQLSESLVRMALARWDGDPEAGLEHHRQAVALLPTLSVAQRAAAPELAPLLQSHAGAFESDERCTGTREGGPRARGPSVSGQACAGRCGRVHRRCCVPGPARLAGSGCGSAHECPQARGECPDGSSGRQQRGRCHPRTAGHHLVPDLAGRARAGRPTLSERHQPAFVPDGRGAHARARHGHRARRRATGRHRRARRRRATSSTRCPGRCPAPGSTSTS